MSSFRDADLFGAATAAAPVEQWEAEVEQEENPAMIWKYDSKKFSTTAFHATAPFYGNCAYLFNKMQFDSFIHLPFIRERREVHLTSTAKK